MNDMIRKKVTTFAAVSLLIAISVISITSVSASVQQVTLINEGFEDGIPEEWENTGWVLNWYGFPHAGSNWISASAKASYIETNNVSFGNDTVLRFWYAAENMSYPMSLDVMVDETLVWSDENFMHRSYQQAIINLSNYTGQHTIRFICQTSSEYVENIDDISLTTFKEVKDENGGDDDNPGGNGGGTPTPPPENQAPNADATKNAQYQALAREEITFDATLSTDDGKIAYYNWDFGDNETATGEVVTHSYEKAGTYTITLEVIDDEEASDTDSFEIEITEGNNPPSIPELKTLEEPGSTNTSYTFFVMATDADNHSISYIFDWDDGSNLTTGEYDSGEKVTVNHSWSHAGIYLLNVKAKDEKNAVSETKQQPIFIEVYNEFIDEEITGYFIDYSQSGNFTRFYNLETKTETPVEKKNKTSYLIDSDGDGDWDYEYNEQYGLITYESSDENNGKTGDDDKTDDDTDTPGFTLIILLVSTIMFLFYWRKKKV